MIYIIILLVIAVAFILGIIDLVILEVINRKLDRDLKELQSVRMRDFEFKNRFV